MQQERSGFKWTTDPAKFNNPDANFNEMFNEERLNKLAEESKVLNQQVLARAAQILTPEQLTQFGKVPDQPDPDADGGDEDGVEDVRQMICGI